MGVTYLGYCYVCLKTLRIFHLKQIWYGNMKIAFTFQILSHNARIFTKEVKNSRREWKMVWRWSHDAATWMRSDPSREVQLQVDLCSQVPSSLGGLLHHLEFADWCSKTLALPARIPISLGSHRILFPACKKPSVLHTSWLHLALWHSLSQSCDYCALSELIKITGSLKTETNVELWQHQPVAWRAVKMICAKEVASDNTTRARWAAFCWLFTWGRWNRGWGQNTRVTWSVKKAK